MCLLSNLIILQASDSILSRRDLIAVKIDTVNLHVMLFSSILISMHLCYRNNLFLKE